MFIFHYEYNQDDFLHFTIVYNVTVQHKISVENIYTCRICAMYDCNISVHVEVYLNDLNVKEKKKKKKSGRFHAHEKVFYRKKNPFA